jgi:hypothetical protein
MSAVNRFLLSFARAFRVGVFLVGFTGLAIIPAKAFSTGVWDPATSTDFNNKSNYSPQLVGTFGQNLLEFGPIAFSAAHNPVLSADGSAAGIYATSGLTQNLTILSSSASSYTLTLSANLQAGNVGRAALALDDPSNNNLTIGSSTTPINLIISSATNFYVNSAATMTVNGTIAGSATTSITITLNGTNTAGTITLNGAVTDGAVSTTKIVVSTVGTANLNGSNSYTGTTTVTAGTLNVNGSTAAASAVTVSGGILGGTGTVGGATTISGAGTLDPGSAAGGTGTLNFGSGLTFSNGKGLFDISGAVRGTSYDSAAVTGTLNYTGLALTLHLATDAGTHAYQLFSFTSESGELASITLTGVYSGSLTNGTGLNAGIWTGSALDTSDGITDSFTFTDLTGVLVTVVPEPATARLALLGGLVLMAQFYWRRGRNSNPNSGRS